MRALMSKRPQESDMMVVAYFLIPQPLKTPRIHLYTRAFRFHQRNPGCQGPQSCFREGAHRTQNGLLIEAHELR